jgi:putative ABC transport system substrate-binding protein
MANYPLAGCAARHLETGRHLRPRDSGRPRRSQGHGNLNTELVGKRVALLKEMAPRIARVALFFNPDNVPDRQQLSALNEAASQVGVAVIPIAIRAAHDYAPAFTSVEAQNADAIMIVPSPLNIRFRSRIVDFALRSRRPTMDAEARGAREGALMSYGPSWADNFAKRQSSWTGF